jgi:hypothetical protein
MRGQTILSYALVAIITTVFAAPVQQLEKRYDVLNARLNGYEFFGALAKVGIVNVGQKWSPSRREAEVGQAPEAGYVDFRNWG